MLRFQNKYSIAFTASIVYHLLFFLEHNYHWSWEGHGYYFMGNTL